MALISAMFPVAQQVRANRIVKGVSIPHPCGDPNLSKEWRVRTDAEMTDLERAAELAEATGHERRAVVGHDAFDASRSCERTKQRRSVKKVSGLAALIREDLHDTTGARHRRWRRRRTRSPASLSRRIDCRVMRCPGRSKRPSRLMSMCSSSPGCSRSYRTGGCGASSCLKPAQTLPRDRRAPLSMCSRRPPAAIWRMVRHSRRRATIRSHVGALSVGLDVWSRAPVRERLFTHRLAAPTPGRDGH